MSEVHYKSATELISLLDAREIGARELLDHFLDRVERYNPAINAIIWQDADRARAEADASDRRRAAGEDTGCCPSYKFRPAQKSWCFGRSSDWLR